MMSPNTVGHFYSHNILFQWDFQLPSFLLLTATTKSLFAYIDLYVVILVFVLCKGLLFFLCKGSHSLWTYATLIAGDTPFPEFSAVLLPDNDIQLGYYDSDGKNFVFHETKHWSITLMMMIIKMQSRYVKKCITSWGCEQPFLNANTTWQVVSSEPWLEKTEKAFEYRKELSCLFRKDICHLYHYL